MPKETIQGRAIATSSKVNSRVSKEIREEIREGVIEVILRVIANRTTGADGSDYDL